MEKDKRWEYLVDLEKTIRDEIETMMHNFSFDFEEEEQGPSGKPMEYCLLELEEINIRFQALDRLSGAISYLAAMRPIPIDWNTAWSEEKSPF